MQILVCTLASGSSGNSTFISIGGKNILLDAGISSKRIAKSLNELNIKRLDAILITHEHIDHFSGMWLTARRFGVPVYATRDTWNRLFLHKTYIDLDDHLVRIISADESFMLDNIIIKGFSVYHDAADPVGYTLEYGSQKIAAVTDIGHVTNEVRENLADAQIILVESNYDPEMLENGTYHISLKRRVQGPMGHLSNKAAGELIADVAGNQLQVILVHLSADNNTPILAYNTVSNVLKSRDVKIASLQVAKRNELGEVVTIY